MADAAAPPLLPTTLTCRRLVRPPPSLPNPPGSSRRAPSPASVSPSASKLGRASSSGSWIRDKAARAVLAPPKPIEQKDVAKFPGRASLSKNWMLDKALAKAEPAPSTESSCNGGCGDRSSESSSDNYGKEQRYAPSLSDVPYDAPSASKPGRSSTSASWIRDKAARAVLAPPKPIEQKALGKFPGRASLSKNWMLDKVLGKAEPAPSTASSCNGGCGDRSSESSSDNYGKEQRYTPSLPDAPYAAPSASSSDNYGKEQRYAPSLPDAPYAGPAFLNSPPPSDLPIPSFVARDR